MFQRQHDSAPTNHAVNGFAPHHQTLLVETKLSLATPSLPPSTALSSWHQWSAFGTAEETTLSSLHNDEVYRGIHPSFHQPHPSAASGGGNEFSGSGNGNGNGGVGGQLFDESSLWPQQATLPHSSKQLELPSFNLTPVTMSSTSSLHAHHASLDDSLDGLIASSSASWTAASNNKELFVSMTAAAAALSEPVCPPRPVYVERWSSFAVNNVGVFDDIVHHLTAQNIDHSVLPHKIRGVLYPTAQLQGSCEFHINRYTGDHDGEWIIEVQRRCGCMFAFKQLYRAIFTLTESAHTNSSPLPAPDTPATTTSSSSGDMQMSVEASTVKQLTNMAASTSVEVVRAGMESLAMLSSISSSSAMACVNIPNTPSLPLLDLASRLVATASAATARAATTLIANICVSSATGVAAVMACDSMVSSLLNMLDAPSSSSLPLRDSKRHCARAIAAMATTNLSALRKATAAFDALPTSAFSATAILDRYTHVDDMVLRSSVVTALNLLRSSS